MTGSTGPLTRRHRKIWSKSCSGPSPGDQNGTEPSSRQSNVRHVTAGTGPAYWGPGELITSLITGEETAGALFMAEISVSPGGGTTAPIHSRGRTNRSTSSEGMLIDSGGRNTITASAGDFVYHPSGIAHSFNNTGDVCAKAEVSTTPPGLSAFRERIRACCGLFRAACQQRVDRPLRSRLLPGTIRSYSPGYNGSIRIHGNKKEVSMSRSSPGLRVNPADETIRLGQIEVRFLITGENSAGRVAVFEVVVPAARPRPLRGNGLRSSRVCSRRPWTASCSTLGAASTLHSAGYRSAVRPLVVRRRQNWWRSCAAWY